jgi:hypothetical protein
MGGPRGAGVQLDPLVGRDDPSKPLRSRLLAVPGLKARYLHHVRTIAEQWLDWGRLGPIVQRYRALIEKEVEADTRKLTSFAAFQSALGEGAPVAEPAGMRRTVSLKQFAEQRRQYLLGHPEISR